MHWAIGNVEKCGRIERAMTRATRILGGAVASVLALSGVAIADHAGGRDSAVGSGVANDPGFQAHISFAAHSDPFGAEPTGHVRAEGTFGISPFAFEGEVTCLRVEGNRASFKYRFKHSDTTPDSFDGGGVEVFVEDNGEPANGDPADRTGFVGPFDRTVFEATDPSRCDPPGPTPTELQSGNLTVHDSSG